MDKKLLERRVDRRKMKLPKMPSIEEALRWLAEAVNIFVEDVVRFCEWLAGLLKY